jgi:hypothetical protein
MARIKTNVKGNDFDWNKIIEFGISPKYVPIPSAEEAKSVKIARDINIGIPPTAYPVSFYVDGITITASEVRPTMRVQNNLVQNLTNKICLIIQLDDELWQFIELDDILDAKGLQILKDWISREKTRLLAIANEYEQNNRQLYHFMYDVIGLCKAASRISSEDASKIMGDTTTALILLHNRVHAEVYSEYKFENSNIELLPNKENSKKPDLKIDETFVDIKSILITDSKDKENLLKNFKKKIKEDIIEKEEEKEQIGKTGTFFVAVWSGIIGSIFYTTFQKMKNDKMFHDVKFHEKIPPFEENKVMLILPSPLAFQNYYLVMDKKRIRRIADYLAGKGYGHIMKLESMSYLALSNIRKGCSFGVTGKNPIMIFKVT